MPQTHQDPEENLPEWLRALRKQQEEEARAAQPEPPAEAKPDGQDPDWLEEIRQRYRPSQPPASAPGAAERPEPPVEDTQPAAPVRWEPEEAPPPSPEGEPEDPADFEDLFPAEEQPQSIAPLFSEDDAPPAFADTPDPDQPASVPAFTEDPEAALPGSDLTGWLETLRPGESYPSEDDRSEAMLPNGETVSQSPLAGLADVLPGSGAGISQIGKPPEFSTRLEVTGSQRQHANVLRELLLLEQQPASQKQSGPLPARLLNLFAGALLVLAVLFPLLSQAQSTGRPDIAYFPEVRNAFNSIDVLPAGAPVLVAFDLQPAQYGEVAPAAAALIGHLLDKQVRLVFISTEETGPALAERLLAQEFAAAPAVSTGTYTNLGYLSGGAAALRSFISDPRGALLAGLGRENAWDTPALENVQHLRDFSLILVVSGNADTARAWIEQSSGELPAGLHAISSAQGAPLLRLYLHSSPTTLRSLVSGVQGAVVYERLQGRDGLGRQYWDAYSYGLGAIVILILLGSLYSRLLQTKTESNTTAPAGGSSGS